MLFYQPQPGAVNVNISETRAPTDESVRLLREMEKAAMSKIIKTIELKNNDFYARVLVSDDHLNFENRGLILFSLNGRKHEVKVLFDPFGGETNMIDKCYSELSRYLAKVILVSVGKIG